jgi:hypothetical protein
MLRLAKLVPEDSSAAPAHTSVSVEEATREQEQTAWSLGTHPTTEETASTGAAGQQL